MIVVAVASGTSVDGIDVAGVDARWSDAERGVVALDVRTTRSVAWPGDVRARLLAVLPPAVTDVAAWCALDNDVGRCLADVVRDVVADASGGTADLVVSPGQTVYHDVVDGTCRGTLQVGQPAWIAERTGVPVVSDLRASDVAAGGHGAPLVALFDACWLGGGDGSGGAGVDEGARAALNLGGIANVTVVGRTSDPVVAFDTGPANCLLDIAAERATSGRLTADVDGRLGTAGTVCHDLLDVLLAHPYFQLDPPKSTGRELFSATFLDEALSRVDHVAAADLLATLTELTARSVADAVAPFDVREVVASGGGARNPALMRSLTRTLGGAVLATSADHGIPTDFKEAVMWSFLGFLTWHGIPGTVVAGDGSSITGAARPAVLGRISPGRGGLRLPDPADRPVTRVIVTC